MTEPLRFSFEVKSSADHAFETWTERIALWWPTDHTVSGSPASVVFEGRVGGRIFERSTGGEVHEWGVVTEWRPPECIGYRWHLGLGPDQATDVAVVFRPIDADRTLVEIEQKGWERLGSNASELRNRNRNGWESLVPHFRGALEEGAWDGDGDE
jgi:hypothetical protein